MDEINKLPEADKIFEIPIFYEEKGKEIGKELGIEMGKKEVAIEMLRKDLDLNLISEVTHLDIEEIKVLNQQI